MRPLFPAALAVACLTVSGCAGFGLPSAGSSSINETILKIAIRLAERREGHQTPAGEAQPGSPVRTGRVPNVGGAAVRLHPEHVGEVDDLTFGARFVCPLGGGVENSFLGRRHTPPDVPHHPRAVYGAGHDGRGIVGEDARHGGGISAVVEHGLRELRDLGSGPHHCVQVADVDGPPLVRILADFRPDRLLSDVRPFCAS
jgi:hypothetical protein